jgi:hypothetical protein
MIIVRSTMTLVMVSVFNSLYCRCPCGFYQHTSALQNKLASCFEFQTPGDNMVRDERTCSDGVTGALNVGQFDRQAGTLHPLRRRLPAVNRNQRDFRSLENL